MEQGKAPLVAGNLPPQKHIDCGASANMLRKHRPEVVEAYADAGPAVVAILGKAPAVSQQRFQQRSVNKFKIILDKESVSYKAYEFLCFGRRSPSPWSPSSVSIILGACFPQQRR